MRRPSGNASAVAKLEAWLATNRESLTQADVYRIEAEYDGCYGFYDGSKAVMDDPEAKPYRIPAKIDRLLERAILEVAHIPGVWFDYEGGGGYLLLSVQSGKITHQSFRDVITTRYNKDVTL